MTRIAILGATGYTALELIKLLLRHPQAEIVALTSRQEGSPPVAMIHPSLHQSAGAEPGEPRAGGSVVSGGVHLQLPSARGQRERDSAACWTPAAAWLTSAPTTASTSPTRSRSGTAKNTPTRSGSAKSSTACRSCSASGSSRRMLVANPGCYPTSAILALAPLAEGQVDRARRDHRRLQERRLRGGTHAETDDPLPRVQRERFGLQRRAGTGTRRKSTRS